MANMAHEQIFDEALRHHAIVRQFTDDFPRSTVLENETKAAHRRPGKMVQSQQEERLERLFRDPGGDLELFNDAEFARNSLKTACDEYFQPLCDVKELSTFRKLRPSALSRLKERIARSKLEDTDDLMYLISTLDEEWQRKHGTVHRNFHGICKTLEAHKEIFKIFPSQNNYLSALCGGLSVIVQASVNHEEIAETLSDAAANLCESASSCAKLLYVVDTKIMRTRLADVYVKLFAFLLKMAQWFTKPRTARFVDSFNTKLKETLRNAEAGINKSIQLMQQDGNVAGLAMIKTTMSVSRATEDRLACVEKNVSHLMEEVDRDRHENNFLFLGTGFEERSPIIQTSQSTVERKGFDLTAMPRTHSAGKILSGHEDIDQDNSKDSTWRIASADAECRCRIIHELCERVDGVALAAESPSLLVDAEVIHKLSTWMQAHNSAPRTLWICTPYEPEDDSGARWTALGTIRVAAHARVRFISCICSQPHNSEVRHIGSPEQFGLLAATYSLIWQLLKFEPESDDVLLSVHQLDQLNGTWSSWETALSILRELLGKTVLLRYCIVHGLNELEVGGHQTFCEEFLDVLVSRTSTVNLLFTTSGHSDCLQAKVGPTDQLHTGENIRSLRLRGMEIVEELQGDREPQV